MNPSVAQKVRVPPWRSVFRPRFRRFILRFAATSAALALFALAWPMNVRAYLDAAPSPMLLDRNGQPLAVYLNAQGEWCFEATLGDINPRLIQATVAAEDQRYYRHHGVDPVAAARAALQNLRAGKTVSGASTITMQVAKLGWPALRSGAGKLGQVITAWRLECRANKSALLQAYLNRANYGSNLIGCEAAARRYFDKPAKELTIAEAALLAGLPKAPGALSPTTHRAKAQARRNYVLARMRDERFISGAEYAEAVATPLNIRNAPFPMAAPHLAMRLASQARNERTVRTTLDRAVQQGVSQAVREHVRPLAGRIDNAAAIVLEVAASDVLAYVGSHDFFADANGQVDVCQALRSPGSALKPFLYAAALDAQKLYPSERLLDDTLDLGAYQPENFDEQYNGLITASEALRTSRNIPAILVTARLGLPLACETLQRAGVQTLSQAPDYYGLGVTLGNCDVRLFDLAGAYRTLAARGMQRAPRLLASDPLQPENRCFSEGAALAVQTMLRQPFPGDQLSNALNGERAPLLASFKTGTSTRHRDAWCFAFDHRYVVGVWLGNSNGSPSPGLLASEIAVPLAETIFRRLPPLQGSAPTEAGLFHDIEVCARSGLPPSEYCPQREHVQAPIGLYLNRRCGMHAPRADGQPGAMEHWPGSTRNWDLATVDATQDAPGTDRKDALAIVSPAPEAEYLLTGGERGDLVKLRASRSASEPLHWYVDGQYLGCSRPDNALFLPLGLGEHRLACMANTGETASLRYTVVPPRG